MGAVLNHTYNHKYGMSYDAMRRRLIPVVGEMEREYLTHLGQREEYAWADCVEIDRMYGEAVA